MQGILWFVIIHTFKSKITWFVTQTSLANQQGSGRWRTVSRRQKESPGFCNQGKTKGQVGNLLKTLLTSSLSHFTSTELDKERATSSFSSGLCLTRGDHGVEAASRFCVRNYGLTQQVLGMKTAVWSPPQDKCKLTALSQSPQTPLFVEGPQCCYLCRHCHVTKEKINPEDWSQDPRWEQNIATGALILAVLGCVSSNSQQNPVCKHLHGLRYSALLRSNFSKFQRPPGAIETLLPLMAEW